MTWYYRCEFKGIQRWILESSRLRDLAGGSALIEDLTERAANWVRNSGGRVVSAAAGGVLATFPDKESLESFAGEWPMFAAYHAPGLQLVQAWVEDSGGGSALDELHRVRLTARRNLNQAPLVEPGPWIDRASRTGMPAVPPPATVPSSRARQTAWDEASVERERALAGRRGKAGLLAGLLQVEEVEADEERWPDEPIAVIHADGSGVGRRIVALEGDIDGLGRFSEALTECTRQATRAALDGLRQGSGGRPLPLRPVVLGGDDLTVVVLARHAFDFVRTWLESFEQETKNHSSALGGGGLCAGAGVVVVNPGYPFWMAYESADRACRDAKKDVLDERGDPTSSAVRFRRITGALADETASEHTWRLEELGKLEELVDAVRGLPRGTLRAWLALLDAGDDRREDRRALWSRAAEVADEKKWDRFGKALEAVGARREDGLFVQGGHRPSTPLRDALLLRHLQKAKSRRRGGGEG